MAIDWSSMSCSAAFWLAVILLPIVLLKYLLPRRKRKNTIAIFHLYCSSGGGGERVLWLMVKALLEKYPKYSIYIYSRDNDRENPLTTLVRVRDLFKIDLLSDEHLINNLEFIPLKWSCLVEAKNYPCFTLLLQSIGSILLACEAAYRFMPEIYMETIGFTFTLPIFRLHQCLSLTYVHYPVISNDMIQNVRTSSHASFNNREVFVRSAFLRSIKLTYYKILALLYSLAGRQADLVMVNSSWTQSHIQSMWNTKTHIVYPPCDTDSFKLLSDGKRKPAAQNDGYRPLNMISIGQFRPEKDHISQIVAFDQFLNRSKALDSKLTLYGGCRDTGDKVRVANLKETIRVLCLTSNVTIEVGAPFNVLLEGVKKADVAIHTMKNEHFGIVLPECMAAGLLVVAHCSGGPKLDIIDHGKDGFLADDIDDFTRYLLKMSSMSLSKWERMSKAAIDKSNQFSTQNFEEKFISLVDQFLDQ